MTKFSTFFDLQKTELDACIYTHVRGPDLEQSASRLAMTYWASWVYIIHIKMELDPHFGLHIRFVKSCVSWGRHCVVTCKFCLRTSHCSEICLSRFVFILSQYAGSCRVIALSTSSRMCVRTRFNSLKFTQAKLQWNITKTMRWHSRSVLFATNPFQQQGSNVCSKSCLRHWSPTPLMEKFS